MKRKNITNTGNLKQQLSKKKSLKYSHNSCLVSHATEENANAFSVLKFSLNQDHLDGPNELDEAAISYLI